MNILIIGGGISGISAAKVALAEKHDVTILESTPEPGGLMARIANCRVGFKTFFDEIRDNEKLSVISDTRISKVDKTNHFQNRLRFFQRRHIILSDLSKQLN